MDDAKSWRLYALQNLREYLTRFSDAGPECVRDQVFGRSMATSKESKRVLKSVAATVCG